MIRLGFLLFFKLANNLRTDQTSGTLEPTGVHDAEALIAWITGLETSETQLLLTPNSHRQDLVKG